MKFNVAKSMILLVGYCYEAVLANFLLIVVSYSLCVKLNIWACIC